MVNAFPIVPKSTNTWRKVTHIQPVDGYGDLRSNEIDRKTFTTTTFSRRYESIKGGNLASLKGVAVKRRQRNKLNPILVDGILRVGGRLERAMISFNAKYPIILPQHHHVTDLIIKHYHRQEGRMGPMQVLATIRQMFWILHGPTEVRRVINNCAGCQKRNAKPGTQVMAPLLSVRITLMNPPFTFVGVDYFGPLMVRQG